MVTRKKLQKIFFKKLSHKTQLFTDSLNEIALKHNFPFNADSEGGMFGLYYTNKKPMNINDIKKSNLKMFNAFFNYMLDNGVFFAPSPYEAGFMSESHSLKDLKRVCTVFENFIRSLN